MIHNPKNVSSRTRKGFTLIELIVTIAILAIILTIVVVAINPAEQLSRSRDAKRVADLDSVKTAITLYLAQATTTVDMDGSAGPSGGNGCTDQATDAYFISRTTATTTGVSGGITVTSSIQTVGATGWMPARMDQTPGGSAIPVLPVDPSGTGTTNDFWYAYACDQANKAFEVTARLESNYFKTDIDVDGSDGGNSAGTYETGNDPGLDLIISGY